MNVEYLTSGKTRDGLKRQALIDLAFGEETMVHYHLDTGYYSHGSCEAYVLDWHDEPEMANIQQIVCQFIEPGLVP